MLGLHWLAEARDCESPVLGDPTGLASFLIELAGAMELTVVQPPQVHAVPGGLAGVVLLGESHASIHTQVAERSAFVDVFSCTTLSAPRADAFVRAHLSPGTLHARLIER